MADLGDFGNHVGRVALFDDTTGKFFGNLYTAGFNGEFNPRGLVFGPDGRLYVSVVGNLAAGDQLTGYILRFNPENGSFFDVFASNQDGGCAVHLHRPQGLVFGPDGRLYVTSFSANPANDPTKPRDTDKILIFHGATGRCMNQIDLYQVGQPRAFAQALLFGPKGRLLSP